MCGIPKTEPKLGFFLKPKTEPRSSENRTRIRFFNHLSRYDEQKITGVKRKLKYSLKEQRRTSHLNFENLFDWRMAKLSATWHIPISVTLPTHIFQ